MELFTELVAAAATAALYNSQYLRFFAARRDVAGSAIDEQESAERGDMVIEFN